MRILSACILLAASLCRSQEPVNQHISANLKTQQSHTNSKRKPLQTVTVDAPNEQTQTAAKTDNNQAAANDSVKRIEIVPQSDVWFRGYVISSIAIALINLGVLFVIWRQRGEMKKQRTIMGDQLTAMQNQRTEMETARKETIKQMEAAGLLTSDLVRQGAAQAAALNISANIMNKQAEIAAEQATIAQTALRLQEASQRQWVDLEDWKVWLDKNNNAIRIRFNIANPTNIPLVLDRISTSSTAIGSAEKIQRSSIVNVLAPRNPSIYDITISLTKEDDARLEKMLDSGAVFMAIKGGVIFTDASKTQWEQTFERYIWCSKLSLVGQSDPVTPTIRQMSNRLTLATPA